MPRRRILIVDDDEDIREALTDILNAEGFEVTIARQGEQAISILKADPSYNLILLDLMMPVMNGEEFCAELNKIPAAKKVPLLVMSAGEHSEEFLRSLGAACYQQKPLDLAKFVAEVKRCLV